MDELSSKTYRSAENCPRESESNKSSAPFNRKLSGGTPPANEPGSICASKSLILLIEAPGFAGLTAPGFEGLKKSIMASHKSIIGNAALKPLLNATTSASHVKCLVQVDCNDGHICMWTKYSDENT